VIVASCGKIGYRSRADALIVLANPRIRRSGKAKGRNEHRAYLCPDCGSWHLTSRRRGERRTATCPVCGLSTEIRSSDNTFRNHYPAGYGSALCDGSGRIPADVPAEGTGGNA
jgi:hypothetical protein